MVGRRGLQNPRGFGLPGLTWFVVLVNDKPLLYAGFSGLGRDCKFRFLFLLMCINVNK